MNFSNTAVEFSRAFRTEASEIKPVYEAFMKSQENFLEDEERKRASIVVSTLHDRRMQNANVDPFLLLKEVTESFQVDPEYRFKFNSELANTQMSGFSGIKNKELFMQA
jgi:hypothetical protein